MKIPNPKHQITNKLQIPITKRSVQMFGSLNIGYWNLFGIWCLGFGACPQNPAGNLEFLS
jgi:hypothetical protein